MIKRLTFYIFFTFCLSHFGANAQNLTGHWEGRVLQEEVEGVYFYSLDINIDGEAVSGMATSTSEDGATQATFMMSGIWDGTKMLLQEIKQVSPEQPKWCLKSIDLIFSSKGEDLYLEGKWTAKKCRPGTIFLKKRNPVNDQTEEKPFSVAGHWTGHLSQSDRDYGFFYEMELYENGTGWSKIISEGNGGEAKHYLNWILAEDNLVKITESKVIERTAKQWKWCIKSGNLIMTRKGMGYILDGNWSGYIENKDPETAICAPGQVILEKPILTKKTKKEINTFSQPYENKYHRKVKVGRTVEVSQKNIKIKIWDSGTVDGDYATLFLNGKRILNNYHVKKTKKYILVTLNGDENVLILHAEDLGDIPPNTVAVSIVDGKNETKIVMNSNLKESGAILIRRFKVKK